MAELNNENNNKGTNQNGKVYATDEAGMLADAKDYAGRDMSTIFKVLERLGITPVETVENDGEIAIELVAKTVIAIKYEQINEARTKRPVWEKYTK